MAKMKVVQCWDDGVINDIRLAELLRKYNAKATFNLCPGLMKENERIPDGWVAKGQCGGHYGYISGKLSLKDIPEIYDGFELASHCWLHENVNNVSTADFVKSAVDATFWRTPSNVPAPVLHGPTEPIPLKPVPVCGTRVSPTAAPL